MKKYFTVIFIASFSSFSFAQKQKVVANNNGDTKEDQWELKFEDNFDSKQLNTDAWMTSQDDQGPVNSDEAGGVYTNDNVVIENGILKIIPKKETVTRRAISWQPDTMKLIDGEANLRTYQYTSGKIETKEQFLYGKFEIRCKIPKGKGYWPAYWMYGRNGDSNNEIDVFEFWNQRNMFGKFSEKKLSMIHQMTVHFNHKMSGESYSGPDFSQEFHTFTVVWDSIKMEWFVDGDLKRTSTYYQTKRGKNVEAKDIKAGSTYYINPIFPNYRMTIIANLAIQGGKNAPDANFVSMPFEIDYIRYYKKVE